MKTVARMALQKGMVIGEDILDYQGRLVYRAGTEVDELVIEKLKHFSIVAVSILEEIDYAKTHYEKIRFDNNFKAFEILYAESIRIYKTLFHYSPTTLSKHLPSFLASCEPVTAR